MDEESSKILEHFQEIVYDNLCLYCTNCKHQGHEETNCRLILKKEHSPNQEVGVTEEEIVHDIQKYTGDARRILNEKRGLEETIQRDDDNVLSITEASKSNAQGVAEVQNNLVNIKTIVGNQIIPMDNIRIGIATVEFDPNVMEKYSVAICIEHESNKALGGEGGHVQKPEHASTLATIEASQLVVVEDNQNVIKIGSSTCATTILNAHHGVSQRLEDTNSRVVVGASLVDSRQKLGDVNAHKSDENHRQHVVVGSNVKKISVSDK